MSWVFVQLLPPSAGPETRWPGRELAADVDLGHCRRTDSRPRRLTLLSQASKQFLCSQPWWPPPEKEKGEGGAPPVPPPTALTSAHLSALSVPLCHEPLLFPTLTLGPGRREGPLCPSWQGRTHQPSLGNRRAGGRRQGCLLWAA